tara:strand:- start:485 stop:2791 length:2307 start_codon:yes stop_codon:yes gene_type:complete
MAGLQQTYSGDLTSSLTGAIADAIFAIATRGKSAKTQALAYAGKYGVDTAFKPGEFTAREGRDYLIEKTLGKRFVPKTSMYDIVARGQSSSDPLMGVPAHVRNLPEYQQLANPAEQKFKENTSKLTGTATGGQKPVKVHDPKLGGLLTAAVDAINKNFTVLSDKLDDTQAEVIQTKESLFGTIKQLEQNSDVLENKLDSIIDALREQNITAKKQVDQNQVAERSKEQSKETDQSGTQRLQDIGQTKEQAIQLNLLEDSKEIGKTSDDTEQLDIPDLERGGIISGPDSGYLARLHGDEMIVPLDNNYTQGEPSAVDGVSRPKPQTPAIPPMNIAETGTSPTPTAPETSVKETPFAPNFFSNVFAMQPPSETPDLSRKNEELQQAMELPIKGAGIATLHLLQKSLGGMGEVASPIAEDMKKIASPIATAFGIPNTVADNIVSKIKSPDAPERNPQGTMDFKDRKPNEKAWWDPFGVFTGKGGGKRGYGGGTRVERYSNNYGGTGGPDGLARGLRGVRAGFTGMNSQGFNAMMQGQSYIPSSKPQILGHGAYSAPTLGGAQRYAGTGSSIPGVRQKPGGVVNSIVPGTAPRINFIEPQARVSPEIFNKGRDLATKLQGGAYPNSARANMLRAQITSGGVRVPPKATPKIGNPLVMLVDMIVNDLINPQPTAVYDQVTGPNAMYNNPKLSEEQRRIMYESVHGTNQGSQKSQIVNMQSQEQALTRLETKQQSLEPIIINNTQSDSTGDDEPVSHINSKGNMGFDELYPSLYN